MVDGIAHFHSERAGDHLRALAADSEVVWCTGWEERANAGRGLTEREVAHLRAWASGEAA